MQTGNPSPFYIPSGINNLFIRSRRFQPFDLLQAPSFLRTFAEIFRLWLATEKLQKTGYSRTPF